MVNKLRMNIYLLLIFLQFVASEKINLQPLSVTRYYFSTTSLQNKGLMFFAGGFMNPSYAIYDTVDIFNATKNSWSTAQLSVPRYFIAATSIENFNLAIFAGGTINLITNSVTSVVDIYNANSNHWTTAQLSIARTALAATSLNRLGLSFFAGGVNTQEVGIVDIYNAFTNSWSTAILSIARDSLAATSLEFQNLVFFGGGDGAIGQTFSTIDAYNATSNKWSVMQLSVNRTNLAATSLPNQGLVFFAGGTLLQNMNLPSDVVDIYNVFSNQWTTAQLAEPSFMLSGTSLPTAGFVFFGGGYSSIIGYSYLNEPVDTISVFNVSDGTWQKTIFSREYEAFAATYLDEYNLVFFGGFDKNINNSPLYAFSTCNAGKYNNTLTTDKFICDVCGQGTYSYVSATKCSICPPGRYCQVGFPKPLPALPGCFNPNHGSIYNCEYSCSSGNYCPLGSAHQIVCPQGTYCNNIEMSSPASCSSGTYNQNIGSKSIKDCITCPSGSYCNSNQSATGTIPCPAQYYCPQNSINYLPCKGGYYCPFASGGLLPCPSGTYCPVMSSVPLICPSGSYCPDGSSRAILCKGGYQCPSGSNMELICPKGTFSVAGSGQCTFCQSGEFTYGEGSTECLVCPVSRINFDGWHCMTELQKVVFAGGWILSLFSISWTSYKLYRWYRERRKKLIENEIQVTWRNIFFYRSKKNAVPLLQKSLFDDGQRMQYLEEMILEIRQEVDKLKNN